MVRGQARREAAAGRWRRLILGRWIGLVDQGLVIRGYYGWRQVWGETRGMELDG